MKKEGTVSQKRKFQDIVALENDREYVEYQAYLDNTPWYWVEVDAAIALPGETIRSANAVFNDPGLIGEGFKWAVLHPDQAVVNTILEPAEPGGIGRFIAGSAAGAGWVWLKWKKPRTGRNFDVVNDGPLTHCDPHTRKSYSSVDEWVADFHYQQRLKYRLLKGPTTSTRGFTQTTVRLHHATTSGVKLVTNPLKTTTVLGSYNADLKIILAELNVPAQTGHIDHILHGLRTGNRGGFNFLHVSDDVYLAGKHRGGFFSKFNAVWIDDAVARGDDFIVVSDRRHMYDQATGEITGFGKEVLYLREVHHYRWNSDYTRLLPP